MTAHPDNPGVIYLTSADDRALLHRALTSYERTLSDTITHLRTLRLDDAGALAEWRRVGDALELVRRAIMDAAQ